MIRYDPHSHLVEERWDGPVLGRMREGGRLAVTIIDWRGRTDSNLGPRRGDAGLPSLEGGEQGPDVAYGEGPGGVPVPGVPLQEGVVIGVQRSLVAHTIQGPHHL